MSNREIPVWLDELAAQVAGNPDDWSSKFWRQADEAIGKTGLDISVDDEVLDFIGLLIEEVERLMGESDGNQTTETTP